MKLHLREASLADSSLLLEWRNDPEAVTQSLSGRHVAEGEHEQWFSNVLSSRSSVIFIASADSGGGSLPAGMCRFDQLENHSVLVSISVAAAFRGKGLGKQILALGLESVSRMWPDATDCDAEVKQGNSPSIALFEGLGFELVDANNDVRRYRRIIRN